MPSDRRSGERRAGERGVPVDRRRKERRNRADRRTSVRLPLELWMEEISGDDVYFRQTGNVSLGGVFFDRAIPHPEGTFITLKFGIPGDKEMVVARGMVVGIASTENGLGMSVKFVNIEGDGKSRLQTYLRAGAA